MKYTNKHGLPEPVKLWLEHDEYDYDPEILSATGIMKPTRMIVLGKRHESELEMDVTEVVASRYGTAIHDSFEKVDIPNSIQEKRYFAKIKGHELSGKPDILEKLDDGRIILWDIKSTSVWTYVYGSRKEQYIKQCSIYRWIVMQQADKPIIDKNAKIIYVFTDWAASRAKEGGNYPPLRVTTDDIELMSIEDTEKYIIERLDDVQQYLDDPNKELPQCIREELWQKDEQWAVMKPGRKTAVKLLSNSAAAMNFVDTVDNGYIEHRPGKVNRCGYCVVTKWCEQYNKLKDDGLAV